jgi:glyoxylase-like metal-dependent hydrolase (beta-lactamase superfamily II)
MTPVARDVWRLSGLIPGLVNMYLLRVPAGFVLIDAGTGWTVGGTLRQLRGLPLTMVALTHAHPDHQGAAHEVCRRFRVPLACHEADADAMEGRRPMEPNNWLVKMLRRGFSGPPHPVSIRFRGGEKVGEWEVVHTPGHTAGHVVFLRRSDGVAVAGDVIRNASVTGGWGRLALTPDIFNVSPPGALESVRALAMLRPSLLLPGHGPPSRDIARLGLLAGLQDSSSSLQVRSARQPIG